MSAIIKAASKPVQFLDERLTASNWFRRNLRKVFPDHWSFMLGEVALFSFIVLLLSGTFLTLWFKPSMAEVVYEGSYEPLNGIEMSEAYASTLDISFDVRGGLLMRQIHHWAALLFLAAMTVHMFRVFFTGAFRKPRELNWCIGAVLILLGLGAGFTGYSLPDDLLSGTGLRIIEGILLSIPVVGTYASSFVFGGEFPGGEIIARLYVTHILLLPGLILALATAHVVMVWYQKHTQWPGPGRTNENVVGYPFFPVYMSKQAGFFFSIFGVIVLMGATLQINPIWLFGPYNPSQVTAGTQPDWYIGFLDGALRVMPNWETQILGFTLSWNVMIPALVMPGVLTGLLIAYPWIERFVTHDNREHHLLDRPRNQPVRTGIGVMAIVFYGMLWLSGGNDFVATLFQVPINTVTWFMRIGLFVLPPLAFVITKRICLGLQRRDRDALLHGRETGIIKRLPSGEFIEVHQSLDEAAAWERAAHERQVPVELGPETDENGVPAPRRRIDKIRARLSRFYFGDVVQKPSVAEVEASHRHGHGPELETPHGRHEKPGERELTAGRD